MASLLFSKRESAALVATLKLSRLMSSSPGNNSNSPDSSAGPELRADRLHSQASFGGERSESDAVCVAANYAQRHLLCWRGAPQLLEPCKCFGLSLARQGMGVEDHPSPDGAGRQGLAQNKSVAGNQHDRLGELDARNAGRSGLRGLITV